MPVTPKQIIKKLEANGFEFVRANGSHRIYRNKDNGKTVVVPFHGKTLKSGTENNILKQAGLK